MPFELQGKSWPGWRMGLKWEKIDRCANIDKRMLINSKWNLLRVGYGDRSRPWKRNRSWWI